jgi:hypothetical protein
MWIHLTARATRCRPLADPRQAWWLWHALRNGWPTALAACLMPDHLHLLIAALAPQAERMRRARVVGAFSRRIASAGWQVAAPEPIRSVAHAWRSVRYLHLNPCRAKLTDDPLAWFWSTHRGMLGAEHRPWVTADHLARALGSSPIGFAQRLHAFVSGDPSVHPNGTPPPLAAPRRSCPDVALSSVVAAAHAATEGSPPWAYRRAAVLLAAHQGWSDTDAIARAVGISARSARRMVGVSAPEMLAAAALCLGDERLRRTAPRHDASDLLAA